MTSPYTLKCLQLSIAFKQSAVLHIGEHRWHSRLWLTEKVTAKTLTQHDELIKKTETMSILIETNKMLREEKDKMEQKLQQTQAKVTNLESTVVMVVFLFFISLIIPDKIDTFLTSTSRFKNWNPASCRCSRPTLSWVKRVGCCRQRRRYWKRITSAGRLAHRSVHKTATEQGDMFF